MDLSELEGLSFSCLPGCGYCCTTSPGVRPGDEAPLRENPRANVVTRADGTVGLALAVRRDGKPGVACGCLDADRRCGVYHDRPTNCRLFPYHVHVGRRVQVSVNLGCPGVWPDRRALVPAAEPAYALADAARAVVEPALAAPDMQREMARAKETYQEFDRRMRELAWPVDQGALARAFAPVLADLVDAEAVARAYSGLASGDFDPRHARELVLSEPLVEIEDILDEVAAEAFPAEGHTLPGVVDRELEWLAYRAKEEAGVERVRFRDDGTARVERAVESVSELVMPWSSEARAEAAAYLGLLTRRDHLWGAAAHLTDRMQYDVTFAAAYARILVDVSAQLLLHAGLAAARRGADEISAEDARDAVGGADMAFLGLPSLGAVL